MHDHGWNQAMMAMPVVEQIIFIRIREPYHKKCMEGINVNMYYKLLSSLLIVGFFYQMLCLSTQFITEPRRSFFGSGSMPS